MFSATSRYANLETATYKTANGRTIVYMRRRFVPVFNGTVLAEHEVVEGDRLDNITAYYLSDPEQFWRICDANTAMKPDDLTAEIGRRLNIPLPTGG
jgi:hypothetical protein